MLRFVVERHEHDFNTGLERRDIFTVDADVPELEAIMKRGGRGEMGFESWQLRGAEILEAPNGDVTGLAPRKTVE